MSFFTALIYDKLLAPAEQRCLKEWRNKLLNEVSGDVLEIGAGTGSNLHLYPDTVERLVLMEPDRHMRRQMEKKIASSGYDVSVTVGTAEHIEADDGTYDYVVASLVCCSVADLSVSLGEISRVLKPGGGLVFLEHVAAAEGTRTRRWQNLVNPLWRKMAGNCHLNRETEAAILAAGFDIKTIKREKLCTEMPLVKPTIRGIALKRA